jgi:serine phosphatase RsbU (regulator of sigma subunit)
VAVVALHLVGALPFQEALRVLNFELYQTALPRDRGATPVVVVGIDDASMERYGQWPWPRNLTARLLDRIWRAQPAAVGLDLQMPDVDQFSACEISRYVPGIDPALIGRVCALPGNDIVLAQSIRRGKAVIAAAGVQGDTKPPLWAAPVRVIGIDPGASMRHYAAMTGNLPLLDAAATGMALRNLQTRYGVVRTFPMVARVGDQVVPSLPLEMLRVAADSASFAVQGDRFGVEAVAVRERFVTTERDGSLWVHYGASDRARHVSAREILEDRFDPARLRGKLVLVGLSAANVAEIHTTALGERVPALEIHAQVLEQLVEGTVLQRPRWTLWVEGALMLAVGLSISWGLPALRARVILPAVLGTIALLCLAGFAAFAYDRILLDVASPLSIFVVMFAFMLIDSMVREEVQRKSLSERLSREETHRRSLEVDLESQREQAARARGEMETARRIQMGMLPDVRSRTAGEHRLDVAAVMEPARLVGGDLYELFMLDADRVFFMVGDVCGKGVPASLFMVVSKTLFRSLALRDDMTTVAPGALLSHANREISRDNPEMLFLTAFVGVLDLRTGELSYCSAGHDKPLVFTPGQAVEELEGEPAPPLCLADEFDYRTHRRMLAPGQFLCLFTDGVTEALNRHDEEFGRSRLIAALARIAPLDSAQGVLQGVRHHVEDFAGGAEPSDDLTLMVLRWRPS